LNNFVKPHWRTWLVGGAPRDHLLGLPVRDRDWLITGATEDELLAAGFRRVGKDFPVFLHPDSHEEYALPRSSHRHPPIPKDFPDKALWIDLSARDLTINAMAQSPDGELIDPFGGRRDIEHRHLRHVSGAFEDDPARILRVARLHARYTHLGFHIAGKSMTLMRRLAPRLLDIAPERLWREISRALTEPKPSVFFQDLRTCGALRLILPEIDALFGVPQPAKHHPEIDTGAHTLMVVDRARALSDQPMVAFAALTHDLGKALTPVSEWPSHHGHEGKGKPLVTALCKRLCVPGKWCKLAVNVCVHHTHCHRAFELKPKTLLKTLCALDAFRQPDKLEYFVLACQADAQGRIGFEQAPYPQADYCRRALAAARGVETRPLIEAGYNGETMRRKLNRARVKAIAECTDPNRDTDV